MQKFSIILDTEVLKNNSLNVLEFLTLLKIKNEFFDYELKDSILLELQDKQFIKIIKENEKDVLILREKANLLINYLNIENVRTPSKIKRFEVKIDAEFEKFIEDYRKLWSGLKPGSKGSLNGCREKMIRWISQNPSYSYLQILNAAKNYIKSVDNYNYLQQADYFIYKKDLNGESSRLSAFIDEDEIKDEGWTNKLT